VNLPRFLAELRNRRRQARTQFTGGNTPVDTSWEAGIGNRDS
jgi:hypothetical protein